MIFGTRIHENNLFPQLIAHAQIKSEYGCVIREDPPFYDKHAKILIDENILKYYNRSTLLFFLRAKVSPLEWT